MRFRLSEMSINWDAKLVELQASGVRRLVGLAVTFKIAAQEITRRGVEVKYLSIPTLFCTALNLAYRLRWAPVEK